MCVFFEIHRDSTNPIFLPSPNVYVPLKFDAGIQGPAEGFPLIFARRSIARKIGSFILCVRSLNICYENERLRELQSRPADYLPNFEYWELTVNRRRRVKFAQGSFLHPLCKRSINVLQVTFDLTRNLKSAGGERGLFSVLFGSFTPKFLFLSWGERVWVYNEADLSGWGGELDRWSGMLEGCGRWNQPRVGSTERKSERIREIEEGAGI